MRLIDADALKEWAEEYHASNWGIPQDELIYAIGSAPPIEPKHGKWVEYPIADGMNQCSVCGVLRFGDSNYCPNCGAKMEGVEDETD